MAMKELKEKPKTVRKVSFETTIRLSKNTYGDFARVFDDKSRRDFCSWAASSMIKHLMYENPDLLNEWLKWQLKRQARSKKKAD